jgi:isatin hydrolase
MQTSLLMQLVQALDAGQLKVVDLTTPLGPDTVVIDLPPIFASSPGVTISQISKFDSAGPAWYWNTINMGEHTGTHFDAPIHWITGKDLPSNTVDTIPVRKFVAPACVIDVSGEVNLFEDFLLTIERVEAWEAANGKIPAGAWVLLRTDWSKRKGKEAFLNVREDGAHSPGFHRTCSEWLATERDVIGVGVETVGTDAGQAGGFDPPFPNHHFMHKHGKFGLASLVNLDQLPPTGAVLVTAPLKLVNGSGSPLRVIAITP